MKKEFEPLNDSPESNIENEGVEQKEDKQPLEVMDYEDLKKMTGLEDIEELNVKIINLERKIEILIERSGHHHDLRHVILHWVAGASASAAVLSFESIRDLIFNGGFNIPDSILKALEALASGIPM